MMARWRGSAIFQRYPRACGAHLLDGLWLEVPKCRQRERGLNRRGGAETRERRRESSEPRLAREPRHSGETTGRAAPCGGIVVVRARRVVAPGNERGSDIAVRCTQCGTENPPEHRFCSMCGNALEDIAASAGGETLPPSRSGGGMGSAREPERRVSAPTYTGGLLHLGDAAETPSRNLDYLLADDEPKSRRGLVLGIITLALVAGLGWLRWRNEGWPRLGGSSAPASATADGSGTSSASDGTAGSSGVAGADGGNGHPGVVSSGAAGGGEPTAPSAMSGGPTPGTALSGAGSASAVVPATAPATSTPMTSEPASTPGPAGAAASGSPDAPSANAHGSATAPAGGTGQSPPESKVGSQSVTPETAPGTATPGAAAGASAAVPGEKPKPKAAVKPEDPVTVGERYLYGRGVTQDCSRGLRYVKPAADRSNAKAMITMGALYATGHCLSKDLPTAYRYFALALRQDPENNALKQNAQMVWSQMTKAERDQAIRMTQ
jgi:hypothetical protein